MTYDTISPSQNSHSCHMVITLGWVLSFLSIFKLGIHNGRCFSESTMGFFFSWGDRPPGKTCSWHVAWLAVLPKWTFPRSSLFSLNPSLVLATSCICLFLHTGPRRGTKPILPGSNLNYFHESFSWAPQIHPLTSSFTPSSLHCSVDCYHFHC